MLMLWAQQTAIFELLKSNSLRIRLGKAGKFSFSLSDSLIINLILPVLLRRLKRRFSFFYVSRSEYENHLNFPIDGRAIIFKDVAASGRSGDKRDYYHRYQVFPWKFDF